MKLVTYRSGPAERLGALVGEVQVLDIASVCDGPAFASMQALIEGGEGAWDKARSAIARPPASALVPLSSVRLLAPLPRPIRLRDCALYLQHMEAALDRHCRNLAAGEPDAEAAYQRIKANGDWTMPAIFKRQAVYYNCDHLSVSGPEDEIVWPHYSDWMDYELEWACVVGRTARDIQPQDARAHIFGYAIFNDWSARDIQLPIMEAKLGPGEGKDFDLGNTLGPCIATVDEFPDPYALTMTARVNGEEWSRGSTGTMHHSFEDAVVQFSRDKVLHAGEVIGSGTVLTGCGFELGRRLADGDLVELEIDGIGVLRNRVLRSAQSLKKSA